MLVWFGGGISGPRKRETTEQRNKRTWAELKKAVAAKHARLEAPRRTEP